MCVCVRLCGYAEGSRGDLTLIYEIAKVSKQVVLIQ